VSVDCRRRNSSYALVYSNYGDPEKVISKVETTADVFGKSLIANQIRVKLLASPINPADINTIQGVYALKPPLPAVAGNEGCAEVLDVGPEVKHLKPGDWVVPSQPGFGTWRSHALGVEDFFLRIDKGGMDAAAVSQITVNPPTAYRMLKDFVTLKPGQTVLQNGANSGVGQNVIQLAKNWGLKTINVIRSREGNQHEAVAAMLKELGADFVVTEEQLRDYDVMGDILKQVPKPQLALNCVGGKNATDCMRHLDNGGVMVTYGGMSKLPVAIPTGALIFKDQKFYGYWMTRWTQSRPASDPERMKMMSEICDLLRSGKLKAPRNLPHELKDFKQALSLSMSPGHVDGKVVIVYNQLN